MPSARASARSDDSSSPPPTRTSNGLWSPSRASVANARRASAWFLIAVSRPTIVMTVSCSAASTAARNRCRPAVACSSRPVALNARRSYPSGIVARRSSGTRRMRRKSSDCRGLIAMIRDVMRASKRSIAIYIAIERLLARITSRIIAISPRQSEDLRRILRVPDERLATIPLGYDLRAFSATGREEQATAGRQRFRAAVEAAEQDTVITMVGRLTAIKNQALALRAFATLARDALHSPLLVLVGGGEDESP